MSMKAEKVLNTIGAAVIALNSVGAVDIANAAGAKNSNDYKLQKAAVNFWAGKKNVVGVNGSGNVTQKRRKVFETRDRQCVIDKTDGNSLKNKFPDQSAAGKTDKKVILRLKNTKKGAMLSTTAPGRVHTRTVDRGLAALFGVGIGSSKKFDWVRGTCASTSTPGANSNNSNSAGNGQVGNGANTETDDDDVQLGSDAAPIIEEWINDLNNTLQVISGGKAPKVELQGLTHDIG